MVGFVHMTSWIYMLSSNVSVLNIPNSINADLYEQILHYLIYSAVPWNKIKNYTIIMLKEKQRYNWGGVCKTQY